MSDVAIHVEGLGKRYRLRHRAAAAPSLREAMTEGARAALRRLSGAPAAGVREEEFWALRDVSFEVRRGEALGIIGRNGAGKSTLLKILSRITEPSQGRARIRGRVASLLEVGTGFHPELTGRENIFLNGAILGMRRAEVRAKFDEIAQFAGVEKFLDTPVKRYSSGMGVRLAFAVAAHLEPEVLVVDEVLAVGDAEFQRRCIGKMRDVATSGRRTVLFVSHSMGAIEALCPRTLLLDAGRSQGVAETRAQVARYLASALGAAAAGRFQARPLSPVLTLEALAITPAPVQGGRPARFTLRLAARERARIQELCLLVQSAQAGRVAIADLRDEASGYDLGPGEPLCIEGEIAGFPLVEGEYSLGIYVNGADVNEDFDDVLRFSVAAPAWSRAIAPYDARHRGLVELDYRFARVAEAP